MSNDHRLSYSILRKKQRQSHRLHYIFIWSREPPANELRYFLNFIFSHYNILNAVAVVQRPTDRGYYIVTYNPFNGQIIRLAHYIYKRHELFIVKDRNLFGYKLFVTLFSSAWNLYKPSRGDSFVPNVVTGVLNAATHLSQPVINEKPDFKQVFNADLLINARYHLALEYAKLQVEPTIVLTHGGICVLVPFERFRTLFETFYNILHPLVWIGSILAAVSVYVSLTFIYNMERRNSHNRSAQFHLHVLGKYFKFTAEAVPRLISSNWLWHYMIITSVFQSALNDAITLKSRVATVDNLNDLINSEYQILVNNAFYSAYSEFINNSTLRDNCEVVGIQEFLHRLYTKNIKYAYMEELKRTNELANDVVDENNLAVFYTMRSCFNPDLETYYVRLGSPFLNRINWILRQLQENGLFKYWSERRHHPNGMNQKLFRRLDAGQLENLYFIFEYWSYALLFCFTVFVVELFVATYW